jgi:hypothetical protein
MRHTINILFAISIIGLMGLTLYYYSVIWAGVSVLLAAVWIFLFPDAENNDDNDVYHHPNRLNTP